MELEEKQRYRGEYKIRLYELDRIKEMGHLERYQKRSMLEFLDALPLDKLKEIVGFKFINPIDMDPQCPREYELKAMLMDDGVCKIEMEMFI